MDDAVFAIMKWIGGAVVAIGGWMGKGMYDDIKELKKDSSNCALKLQEFKTEVANDYAKEASVQMSLARLYSTIESGQDRMEAGFESIRADIKALLSRK